MEERSHDEGEGAEVVLDWDDEAPTLKITEEKERQEQIPDRPPPVVVRG